MVRAFIVATQKMSDVASAQEATENMLESVIRGDAARFVHLIPARSVRERMRAEINTPAARLVAPEDLAWSRLGMAREVGWAGHSGPLPVDRVGEVLNRAVDVTWNRVESRLRRLERQSVLVRALVNDEAIDRDRSQWFKTASALLSLYDDSEDVVDAANRAEASRSLAGVASRAVAEMALSTCPFGSGIPCSNTDLDLLMADTAVLLECASQSDAARWALMERMPQFNPDGSLRFDRTFVEGLYRPYLSAHGERELRSAADQYGIVVGRRGEGAADVPTVFNEAFRDEFGLYVEDMAAVLMEMATTAIQKESAYFVVTKPELLALFSGHGRETRSDPEKAYRTLVLVPRSRWNEAAPENAAAKDWYPWRYNRRLSVTRKPLIQLDTGSVPGILIIPALFDRVFERFGALLDGGLPGELFDSAKLRAWIGGAVDRMGHEFNKKVATSLQALGFEVACELPMTTLGGEKRLGDIDVLAWSSAEAIIFVIECKRLSFARSIGEVGERLADYTRVAPAGQPRTAIQKHSDRVTFLQGIRERLSHYTGVEERTMKIRSVLVTDYIVPMGFSRAAKGLVDGVIEYKSLSKIMATTEGAY